jgi:hypothetical protein
MTGHRKRGDRRRPEWFWRFRTGGAAAYVEETEDGRWRVTVGRQVIATCANREIANAVVDELDAKAKGGGHGDK